MRSFVLLPGRFASSEYVQARPFDEIKPYSLLSYEDAFDLRAKDFLRVIKELEKLLCRHHSGDIKKLSEEAFNRFFWKIEKFPVKSFGNLIKILDQSLKDIKMEIKLLLSVPFEKDGFNYEFLNEDHMFLDVLYCVCAIEKVKDFKKNFQAELLECVDNKALFKVFTLKKETDYYKSLIQSKGYSIICPKFRKTNGQVVSEQNKKNLLELFFNCHETLMISVLSKGICEMLNKYNLYEEIKYKLVDRDLVDKEIKIIKKQAKGYEIEEILTIVDIGV